MITLPALSEPTGEPLTMSSREIADLVEKRHDNVVRDIRVMLTELHGEEGVLKFEDTLLNDQNGQRYPIFRLPKRETLILVSGYRIDIRAKIIDRWQELEAAARPAPLDYSDPKVLLGVLDHLQGKVKEQAAIIEEQSEKVRHLARLEGARGTMCFTDAAKTLGIAPSALIAKLHAERWIYKRPGNRNWVAHETKRRGGLLDHAEHTYTDSEGEVRVSTRCLVTAKGLVKIAEMLERPLL